MTDQVKTPITREDVLQYLESHPEFFERNPDSLLGLRLSHPSGQAVSLIERQVSALRERNTELRHKLHELLESARENDRLYEHSKRLVLALLECTTLGDLVDVVNSSFDQEFNVPYTQLVLVGEPQQLSNAKFVSEDELEQNLGSLLRANRSSVGAVPEGAIQYIFAERAMRIGSAAVAPLSYGQPLGVLAIGHQDKDHYRQSGGLFLNHIAQVIARLVFQLEHSGRG